MSPVDELLHEAEARQRRRRRTVLGIVLGCTIAAGAVLTLALAALFAVGFLAETKHVPDTAAHPGDELPRHVLDWLHDEGLVLPDETIVYFYSAGFLSYAEDGNFFTEDRVVSYWQEEDDLHVYDAAWDAIADFEITWSESFFADTHVRVHLTDGTWFDLLVSAEGEGDRRFVEEMERRWEEAQGG